VRERLYRLKEVQDGRRRSSHQTLAVGNHMQEGVARRVLPALFHIPVQAKSSNAAVLSACEDFPYAENCTFYALLVISKGHKVLFIPNIPHFRFASLCVKPTMSS
jgi:hypothetical protein